MEAVEGSPVSGFGLGAMILQNTRLDILASSIVSDTKALQGPISQRMGRVSDGATFAAMSNASAALSVEIGKWHRLYESYLQTQDDAAAVVLMDAGSKIHGLLAQLSGDVNEKTDSKFLFYLRGAAQATADTVLEAANRLNIDPSKILGQVGWLVNNAVPIAVASVAGWFILPKIVAAIFTSRSAGAAGAR